MKSFGEYIDEAIPHEAGHILVGWSVGLRARGLDVEIVRLSDDSVRIGNFATLAYSPPDEVIPQMNQKLRAAYMLFVSGGVAGNKFAGLKTACQGADADRKELARLSSTSLEELAGMALEIIKPRGRAFRQLVSIIRQRFTERIWTNPNTQTGRLTLLAQEDLDNLFDR